MVVVVEEEEEEEEEEERRHRTPIRVSLSSITWWLTKSPAAGVARQLEEPPGDGEVVGDQVGQVVDQLLLAEDVCHVGRGGDLEGGKEGGGRERGREEGREGGREGGRKEGRKGGRGREVEGGEGTGLVVVPLLAFASAKSFLAPALVE